MKKRTSQTDKTTEKKKPAFFWAGHPVFRCVACPYERVDNLEAVLTHEREAHAQPVQPSLLLGLDGKPLPPVRAEKEE